MNRDERNDRLIEAVRAHLEEREASLDARTAARLREMRFAAVEEAGRRRWFAGIPRWATAGGLATIAVAVVATSLWLADVRREKAVAGIDDMEIITTQEHIQLYEDLDFYRWLAEQDRKG
ncbi:hypothetical protein [Geobacter pickeringii]|uniref:DUF3619 domain-containing protein n=1 Tax=Geobacter pickeringii TaxID=345632 RepID=A0A0B5B818_9BACT|nr:hypothetical protein [Geobacter pickeringii]AJE02702.1 hypothetical protein GPICK_04355 [Geobacter pickeringii]